MALSNAERKRLYRQRHPDWRSRSKSQSYQSLSPEQKRKANIRAQANQAQRRGNLIPQPCQSCGNPNSQKHHPSYDHEKKFEVIWLCEICHKKLHLDQNEALRTARAKAAWH